MSILTDRTRERLATHTPQETLESLREQLLNEQMRRVDFLKQRMSGDMSDIELALEADKTHAEKRGFE